MIDYGRVRNTIIPDEIEVDEYSVWVNTDVQEIEVTFGEDTHTEYEYNQVRYTKEEYQEKMFDDIQADMVEAVIDEYKSIVGED